MKQFVTLSSVSRDMTEMSAMTEIGMVKEYLFILKTPLLMIGYCHYRLHREIGPRIIKQRFLVLKIQCTKMDDRGEIMF